ncbi:S8 family peptidase [Amycolatopsis sp. YIM 10]|uniref:S8 family peptidase n=1 Tax=Amycolatopsis sp. YIM 10 TaxID=2653857 RepID=UPI0012902267|nr:Extracellular serine proteinase precursor [Amycolatopsis sp. YIM 10]
MTLRRARAAAVSTTVLAAVLAIATPAQAGPGEQPNPPSWGLDRIDQRTGFDQLYRYETRAETVTAYVIDTGVSPIQDLAGQVLAGKDFIDGDTNPADGNGHGTHLAAIIGGEKYGVAKDVKIVPVRVLDNNGSGTVSNVVAGIDWVRQNAVQPAVAVLGVGGAPNTTIDNAVRGLAAVVPVAVPAGGSASDAGNFSPARVPEVLTVASSDQQDRAAGSSNHGASVDLYAPGVSIPSPTADGGVRVLSGTSTAAAHVTGAAALYRALHPGATAPQAAQAVVDAATKDKLTGVPAGTPNRLLYTLTPG